MTVRRTAHPYDDADVVDARAPRFNQATVGIVSLVALLTGWWVLLAVLAVQLIVGLRGGRRYCLPCVFYFEVVQPRIGEGEIEDARPPRFANILGAMFLSAATLAHLMGFPTLGWIVGGMVAGLALLAAATGFCAGCEIYRLTARLRGIRRGDLVHIDLDELGAAADGRTVVQFTHPLCTGCRELEKRLAAEGHRVVLVDVSRHRDVARKYHVSVVPTAVTVAADGHVVQRIA
jgi:hypothetical protein